MTEYKVSAVDPYYRGRQGEEQVGGPHFYLNGQGGPHRDPYIQMV